MVADVVVVAFAHVLDDSVVVVTTMVKLEENAAVDAMIDDVVVVDDV